MIATLQFTLPEERAEHLSAVKARDLVCAILAVERRIRELRKDAPLSRSAILAVDEIAKVLYEEINENGLREVLDG